MSFKKLVHDETKMEDEVSYAPTSRRAILEADESGGTLEIVLPLPNQLQIDIDDSSSMDTFLSLRDILDRYYAIINEVTTVSKSGNRHITLTLGRDVSGLERIALQACLGSDRKRELLSIIQEIAGDPHPTLFLEKKKPFKTAQEVYDERRKEVLSAAIKAIELESFAEKIPDLILGDSGRVYKILTEEADGSTTKAHPWSYVNTKKKRCLP